MNKKRIGLRALVLMMFTMIFSFSNGPVAFKQMGYASIIWYILAALLFFLPTSMMYAEYGSTFKEKSGGIYSWMERSFGKKISFIVTFIGYATLLIWMVTTAQKVWIPLSTMIWGHDETSNWSIFGFSGSQTVGILAILFILVVTFFVTHGLKSISRISTIGGTAVMTLNAVLVIASIIVVIAHGGQFAQPIHVKSFFVSTAPGFTTLPQMLSFALYAIFAYAGLEQLGGIIDNLDNAEKNYPKAVSIATVIISFGYVITIILWGATTNWNELNNNKAANLGNIPYILMNNLGYEFGGIFGLSHQQMLMTGSLFSRITGISMFLAYLGSVFVLTYAPVKAFVLGTPKEIWPSKLRKINKYNIPANAVWTQAIIICVLILLISFGGKNASQLYLVLTNMGNVAVSLPYVFVVLAFPFFKNLKDVKRPFVFYKSKMFTWIITIITDTLIVISIGLTIVQPFQKHDFFSGIWTLVGPVLFGFIAWLMYEYAEKKYGKL